MLAENQGNEDRDNSEDTPERRNNKLKKRKEFF